MQEIAGATPGRLESQASPFPLKDDTPSFLISDRSINVPNAAEVDHGAIG